MEKIEKDLILLGEAAVEDKLQNGVPECIEKLAQAGIKIWVLTGDKIETAINIGFACSLLRQGMKQIIITLETPEIKELEKTGNKDLVAKESKESIAHQIRQGKTLLTSTNTETSALIIDGKSLLFALDDNLKSMFLELANGCASVMCCRTSPKQKAPVTRLVKTDTSRVTLAIGDGANDVGMLQEADIGIRISGAEGMQAVMSSDMAIAQFRFLEHLLLVHGHWCYRRISSMFPLLYQLGVQNILFSWLRILGWMLNGVLNAIVIFFFCTKSLEHQAFRRSGEVVGLEILGAAMYTCILWVVNLQMALAINYFTLIQHAFIWGSIILWYLFLLAFGAVTPIISTTAFMVFEGFAAAPLYWAATLFVVVAILIPYFTCKAIQTQFFPMYHEILQWLWLEEQSNDPENYQMICEGLGNL